MGFWAQPQEFFEYGFAGAVICPRQNRGLPYPSALGQISVGALSWSKTKRNYIGCTPQPILTLLRIGSMSLQALRNRAVVPGTKVLEDFDTRTGSGYW